MSENPKFIPHQSEAESGTELSDEEKKAVEKELFAVDKQIFDLEEELEIMNDGLKLEAATRPKQKSKKKLSREEKEVEESLSQKNLENIAMIKEGLQIAIKNLKELQNKQTELISKLGPEHATKAYSVLDEVADIRKELKKGAFEIKPNILEYIKALAEVFKGETLDEIAMPKPEELTDEYFDKMYPAKQREADTARGLVSYRSSWWNQDANKDLVGQVEETWGQVYARSMKSEAERFTDSIIFSESIQKPKYKNGSQQYGTTEGDDADIDQLLPLINEVFGKKANRFNLSWDDITAKLIPKIKEKIQEAFAGKHLSVPNFEVILTPALISNRQMTEQRPENSQTNTSEWTSTILLKQDGTDSGHRLLVGHSERGGAAYVDNDRRGN